MWLNLLSFIFLCLLQSSSHFISISSNHLCVFAINYCSLDCNVDMCFAKTKTLKSLRSARNNQNTELDLEINCDDTCDYLTNDSLELIESNVSDLNIVHLNIRGLKSKINDLNELLVKLKNPEIIILNETWLKESDNKRIILPNYKYEGIPRNNKKGGGVGFLIRTDILYRIRNDLIPDDKTLSCEQCYIEIKNNTEKVIIGTMYRPPSTNISEFINTFNIQIDKINKNGYECIIGLDHNLDLLKQSVHSKTQEFLECILDHNLLPTITKPTRISKTSATLIDNILISKKLQPNYESLIIVDDLSDHLPCLVKLKNFKPTGTKNFILKRVINNKAVKKINEDLSKIDWDIKLKDKPASDSFHAFHSEILISLNKHAPEKLIRVKEKRVKNPWMSKGLKNSLTKSKKLYERALIDPAVWSKYKEFMTILRKCKRKLKLNYYQNKCNEFRKNGKKMWTLINKINGRINDKTCIIDYLKVNNIKYLSGKDISNQFGKYFSSVGKEFALKIGEPKTPLQNYLERIQINPKCMFFEPVTMQEVSNIIQSLKPKHSSGYDDISNRLIKELHPVILKPLTEVINRSLQEGTFPDDMKRSDTIPLYKTKEKYYTTNYRPISLLLTLSKILEKVVYKRTVKFLDKNELIYNSQYGFREKHSCVDAVMELTTEILKSKENNLHTISVFLDLSKAFDTLDPKILIKKLEKYGLRGVVLNWFESYLTNRQLRVKCEVAKENKTQYSNLYDVEYGAPQGSCLGPLLFLLFTNDLYLNIEHCSAILFADDTTLYKSHRNTRYLKWCIEQDLKTISDWFKANKLTLNLEKTEYIFFGARPIKVKPTLEIDNVTLRPVETVKFLGLWLDQNLNWDTHVNKLTAKIKRNLHLLRTPKHLFNKKTLKLIYHAQIQSHINYGLILWGSMTRQNNLLRVQSVQNKCVEIISGNKNIELNFKSQKILNIKELIKMQEIKVGYRLINKMLPNKISQQMQSDSKRKSLIKTHTYNTRGKKIPNLPKVTKSNYINSYLYQSIKQFMLLPLTLQNMPTLSIFITNYKRNYWT